MLFRIMRRQYSNALAALILLGLSLFSASSASAHNIPVDSLVQAYMKPQGHVLQVLMRMPLKSYADGDYYHHDNGSVDVTRADGPLRTAAQVALFENLKVFENGRQLPFPHIVAVRMALDSDRSFATYDQAMAEMKAPPLAAQGSVFWDQAKVDVWFEYPIQSDQSNFAIHASFDHLAVHETTALQFISPNGINRAYDLAGDAGLVSMDPSWVNAATRFVAMGFHHILEGIDHLLFLFCLIIPYRSVRGLIAVIVGDEVLPDFEFQIVQAARVGVLGDGRVPSVHGVGLVVPGLLTHLPPQGGQHMPRQGGIGAVQNAIAPRPSGPLHDRREAVQRHEQGRLALPSARLQQR